MRNYNRIFRSLFLTLFLVILFTVHHDEALAWPPNVGGPYNANGGASGSSGGTSTTGANSVMLDPRNYGAKCTGAYGASGVVLFNGGGSGWNVGDKFMLQDQQLEAHMRGGANAIGRVTGVSSGAITTFVMEKPGSGYYFNALWGTPITGTGSGASFNVNGLSTPPSAPSTTLAVGGAATCSTSGSTICGGAYQVNDLFAVPNPARDGNYMVGRVTGVSGGRVTTYTILNPGGNYAIVSAVPATTITGYGKGLTINVTSTTSANGTWDDTYGITAAEAAASAQGQGAAVIMPDNCWAANLPAVSGTSLIGQLEAPNYGYGNVPSTLQPSGGPHLFIIGTPSFGIDLNNAGDFAMRGFEVRGYTGGNFGASTTWDSTACIGTFAGAGTGGLSIIQAEHMSAKSCKAGIGSPDGTGAFIFAKFFSNDWGANQVGIYGPFSDLLSAGDTIPSTGTAIWLSSSAGGLARIEHPRIEYATDYGIRLDGFGSLQASMTDVQVDRVGRCAVYGNGTQQINIEGGSLKGAGLAGTLTVTGAASGTAGVVRLTVTGFGFNPSGGSSATSGLTTGDIANVSGVGGTTEANGNQRTITVVDNTHIELQGTTFVNAYTSGGLVAVNGKDAYICLNNTSDFHSDNVGFYGYSAGTPLAAATVIDATGSTLISMDNGAANTGNGNSGGWQQAVANWHNSGNTAPANTLITIPGTNTLTAVDYGNFTTSLTLPKGTTGQEPTCNTAAAGSIRYNTTVPQTEVCSAGSWTALSSGGGTVNAGTINQVAYYAATGTTVGGDADLLFDGSNLTLGATTAATGAMTINSNGGAGLTVISSNATQAGINIDAGPGGGHKFSFFASANNPGLFGFYDTTSAAFVFGASTSTVQLGSGNTFSWNSTVNPTTAPDLAISRSAGGVLAVGTGTAGNTTGKIKTAAYMSVGTKFTASGCSNSGTVGGATAGRFTSGTTGACTVTITMGDTATAPNGWSCTASDQTTPANIYDQTTGGSTTTAVLTGTTVTNDVISFSCIGY